MTWYQNAIVDGVPMPAARERDTSQRRWKTLIAPLVPPSGGGRLFLDLGCNAGFYLREALKLGYDTLGVELNATAIEQAKYWEEQEPSGVQVVQGDISKYEIPPNYLTLLANVLYWLTFEETAALMRRLTNMSQHVLIVSRHRSSKQHRSLCSKAYIRGLFWGWELVDGYDDGKHYSQLASNPYLCEYVVEDLFNLQPFINSRRFLPALQEYVDLVVSHAEFRPEETAYWKYCVWRRWGDVENHLERLKEVILTIERERRVRPIEVLPDGKLKDGNHRLIIAERLGLKKVLCRAIK